MFSRDKTLEQTPTLKEAQEFAKIFRSHHEKEEPFAKTFSKVCGIIYAYDFRWKFFNYAVKAFSYEIGKNLKEARYKLRNISIQ